MSTSEALSPGTRLRSAVCTTEVVLVRVAPQVETICCGGEPMLRLDRSVEPSGGSPRPGLDTGTELGKRYGQPEDPVELLCTKSGAGTLSVGERPLALRAAKPLPASD